MSQIHDLGPRLFGFGPSQRVPRPAPVPCCYCAAPLGAYRLDVDGEAYCSLACHLKRQQWGTKLNETIHETDRAQGAFWFEEG